MTGLAYALSAPRAELVLVTDAVAEEQLHVDGRALFVVDIHADARFFVVLPVAAEPHVSQAALTFVGKQGGFGRGTIGERIHGLAHCAEALELIERDGLPRKTPRYEADGKYGSENARGNPDQPCRLLSCKVYLHHPTSPT